MMKELNKDKWLWYTGKMSKEDIEFHKWEYDPFIIGQFLNLITINFKMA